MRPSALLLLAAVPALGCATAERRPTREEACHGTAINLDRVADICAIAAAKGTPPPPAALEASILPTPLHVVAGEVLHARVRLTNTTAAPLDVDVGFGCQAFEVAALREDNTIANRPDSDAAVAGAGGGSPCTPVSPAHVTLDPNGWLEKEVAFTASKTQTECPQPKQPCHEAVVGVMEPGTYRLQVQLPFADPVPGQEKLTAVRVVESPLVVSHPER